MELIAENLGMDRGGRQLFAGLHFRFGQGTFTRLSGENGAGKTSLLRLIAGLSEKASGTIRLEGGDPDLPPGAQAHYVAHQEAVKSVLTARENLQFWASFLGGGEVDQALEAFGLLALADHPAGWLSQGQKRRLALCRLSLCHRPLWLLDEPTSGLDARSEDRLADLISRHLKSGGLVVAASHLPLNPEPNQDIRLGKPA